MSAVARAEHRPHPPDRRLAALLEETWRSVPAYRALWSKAGLDRGTLSQLRSEADLPMLPVIRKSDLQHFPLEERCAVPLAATVIERTSGSTGEPFEIPLDAASRRRRRLRFLRALLGCGYRPGQRLLMLTTHGSTRLARAARWDCADITLGADALAERYLQLRPRVLYGPLNTLMLLAQGLAAKGEGVPLPARVISTAEQLEHADRRSLRQAFGSDPGDFYGMSECGLLAVRPPGRRHFAVAGRGLLLEFLPCARDPGLERLVITDLAGGAMPLIRFDTGDLVARDHTRPDRPIVAFRGRGVDCLRLPDGGLVSPYRVTLALEDIAGLRRYRIVQRMDLSVDARLWVDGVDPAATGRAAGERLDVLLAGTLAVRIQASADAPPGGRKFRPVRSEAKQTP